MTDEALKSTLEKIGSKLAKMRKAKGYVTHEYFTHHYHLPRVQYWRMEKGKTNLTIKSLGRILEIYGSTIEDFFSGLKDEVDSQN